MALIDRIKATQAAGADETALTAVRTVEGRATFQLDFVEAEHSGGFHAGQEAARVRCLALNHLRQGQMARAGQPVAAADPAPEATSPRQT